MNNDNDTSRGLYMKYRVERTDGSSGPGGKHEACDYFVLDLKHDKFAYNALVAYANACEAQFPHLYDDLIDKLNAMRPHGCVPLRKLGEPQPEPCLAPAIIEGENLRFYCIEHAVDLNRRGYSSLGRWAQARLLRRGVVPERLAASPTAVRERCLREQVRLYTRAELLETINRDRMIRSEPPWTLDDLHERAADGTWNSCLLNSEKYP
jgi:hypothetical protein